MTPTATTDPGLGVMPPPGSALPYDDGVPLESPWHRDAMNLLIESVNYHRRGRTDYFAGGNMFFYYSTAQTRAHDFRGPDVFVVNGADGTRQRNSWVVWEEDGRVPNVIVEMVSESTRRIDLVDKLAVYTRTLLIPEYFCVDPAERRLYGWRRYKASVEPIEDEGGKLWCSELEAYLGWWEGTYQHPVRSWLPRLFDVRGNLIPIFREASDAEAIKAQANAAKAHAAAATAQSAATKAQAEATKAQADAEKAQAAATAEKRRADDAIAELARLKAELEALRPGTPPTP